ncbi:LolA family protein [Fodinicola feengrottensis]|uniref:LolA family protein n=1 Tax=Fodinicola feengrottensis TaxID=435914 RepID=UPI0024410274|nr:hypothetical protein [Fodinicola feengrottensis]
MSAEDQETGSENPPGRRKHVLRWAVPAGIVALALARPVRRCHVAGGTRAEPAGDERTAVARRHPDREGQRTFWHCRTNRRPGVAEPAGSDLTGTGAPSTGSSSLLSMVSGSHTLRVWYASPDKGRVALLGQLGESDIVYNNHDLWTWSSSDHTATHRVVQAPARKSGTPSAGNESGLASGTPQELAAQLLKAVGPTTTVSTTGNTTVAGRKVYELLLQPKDTRSLVGQVRLAVDGETKLPLQVEVFASGAGTPAIKVGFTLRSVSARRPRTTSSSLRRPG